MWGVVGEWDERGEDRLCWYISLIHVLVVVVVVKQNPCG